jgi:hypothetical protein
VNAYHAAKPLLFVAFLKYHYLFRVQRLAAGSGWTRRLLISPIDSLGWGVFEFFIGLAQGVLVNVISDLVKGKRAVANRQIRSSVEELAVARQRLSREQLDEVVQYVMVEIGGLVEHDPDLVKTGRGGIKLAEQVPRSRDVQGQREVLEERFRRLGEAVERRRRDLGMPNAGGNRDPHVRLPPSLTPTPLVVWEPAEAPSADVWNRELEEMKRRIDQRRGRGPEDEPGRQGSEGDR